MSYKENVEKFDACKKFLKQFVGFTAICYVGTDVASIMTVFDNYKVEEYAGGNFEIKKNGDETLYIPVRDINEVSINGSHIRITYGGEITVGITVTK